MSEVPKVVEKILMEVGCRFFEAGVEGVKEKIASWISAQPYGTRFTASQLLKELEIPYRELTFDLEGVLGFFVEQGWIDVDECFVGRGVDCLSGVKVYRVLLNKPINRERLVQIRKAEIL